MATTWRRGCNVVALAALAILATGCDALDIVAASFDFTASILDLF